MKTILFCSLMFLVSLLCACSSDYSTAPPVMSGPPPGTAVSFSNDVLPIFSTHRCTSCHGGTAGLTVTTVADLLRGGNHGPAIIPGNADSSILVQKISTSPPFGSRMPLGGPYLPDATISIIKQWINEGAKNN